MFKRILIANRGEIALRIIRCCREMDVETVIVYSTADKDSLAVMAADKAVCIGPAKAAESYLNQDAIIETAILTGCEAVQRQLKSLRMLVDYLYHISLILQQVV